MTSLTLRLCVALSVSLGIGATARASDLLGFYVGAGAARTEVSGELKPTPSVTGTSFSESDTGWKALVGIRALSLFGAELEYTDLGSASRTTGAFTASADLKSTALFGLFWLPIPAPFIDVYAKAGYVRLDGTFAGRSTGAIACPAAVPMPYYCAAPFSRSIDDDAVAAGAGAQLKLGSWALRGDYERFFAAGSDPHVISLSVVKFFL